jgi:putative phosphoesterase
VVELRRADLILHAGDLSSVAFLDDLRSLGPQVLAVCGNADEPALRELLPAQLVAEVGPVRIAMTHNGGPKAGREARLAARFPGCDAVVYGHSHVPELQRHGAVWILNPGSPTDRRRQPDFTMIVARVSRARLVPKLLRFAA